MRTVINPGLSDRVDAIPARVYRIMTPSVNGLSSDFLTVSKMALGPVIPTVTPLLPLTQWASAPRFLGVRAQEVRPQNPQPGVQIEPGPFGQDGAGMSVIPVIDFSLLPNQRIPKRNGGTGSNVDCWFFLPRNIIENSTTMRLHFDIGDSSQPSRIAHGVIEPSGRMMPSVFISALQATAPNWICLNK
jgi:hypothetical protein